MFKVGNKIQAKKEKGFSFDGEIGTIVKVWRDDCYRVRIGQHKGITLYENEIEKLPLNNSLNKRLYPNRKEYEGYLIPAKEAAKLNEEQS